MFYHYCRTVYLYILNVLPLLSDCVSVYIECFTIIIGLCICIYLMFYHYWRTVYSSWGKHWRWTQRRHISQLYQTPWLKFGYSFDMITSVRFLTNGSKCQLFFFPVGFFCWPLNSLIKVWLFFRYDNSSIRFLTNGSKCPCQLFF